MTWSQREWMCEISESEISVPIEISAAAFRTASRSSGRIWAKSVSEQFVRKPMMGTHENNQRILGFVETRTHSFDTLGVCDVVDDDFRHLGEMPAVPLLQAY